MEKSKLIEILLTFDKREKRQFRLWLQSPIHNLRTDVILLFDFFCNHSGIFDKQEAWMAVHPIEPYDDARLRQIMYFMGKQIEDFLIWQDAQTDLATAELSKLHIYRRRQLERPFNSSLDSIKKILKESPYRNSRYLRDISMMEMETFAQKSAHKRDQSLNLQETTDALDLAYIAEKLRISCLMLSHAAVYRNVEYQHGALPLLVNYVEQNQLLTEPAIAVYYHCYMASIDRTNEVHFKALLAIITEKRGLFPLNELRELYLFALNFCIYWSNRGSSDYLFYMFNLYKTGFEQRILFENGVISRFTFFNAVGNAIKIKEFKWANDFIHSSKPFLEDRYRNATVLLSLARLFFEQNQLDKAQEVLHNYNSEDLLHVLIAKRLLAKIYFARKEFDALNSLLDSMSVYLKRKDSLDMGRQEGYKSFLKMLKKIVHAWPLSTKQRASITQDILATKVILEKDWLLAILKDQN